MNKEKKKIQIYNKKEIKLKNTKMFIMNFFYKRNNQKKKEKNLMIKL